MPMVLVTPCGVKEWKCVDRISISKSATVFVNNSSNNTYAQIGSTSFLSLSVFRSFKKESSPALDE